MFDQTRPKKIMFKQVFSLGLQPYVQRKSDNEIMFCSVGFLHFFGVFRTPAMCEELVGRQTFIEKETL